jgi:hypothetical protein
MIRKKTKCILSRKYQVWKLAEYSIILIIGDPKRNKFSHGWLHPAVNLISGRLEPELEHEFYIWEQNKCIMRIS